MADALVCVRGAVEYRVESWVVVHFELLVELETALAGEDISP